MNTPRNGEGTLSTLQLHKTSFAARAPVRWEKRSHLLVQSNGTIRERPTLTQE